MKNMNQSWKKRLQDRMKSRRLNMKSLSVQAGYSDTFVYDILKRGYEPTIDKVIALADVLNVSLNWLLYGDNEMVERPVSGIVGAGQEVIPLDNLDEQPFPDMVSVPSYLGMVTIVQVRGDSMKPRYEDRDLIAYGPPAPSMTEASNKDCVIHLRDGHTYLKRLKPGTEPGTAILLSTNADPLINVKVDWAAPLVDWIKRGYDIGGKHV